MKNTASLLARSLRSRPRSAGLVAAIAIAAIFVAARSARVHATESSASVPASPPPPTVTVAPVEERLVTEYEELTGRVDATETVELRARVSGYLETVEFQSGQLVRKGDLLFTIDPRPYQAQFDLATAQVEQARAHAEDAAREARRADGLLTSAAISSEEAEARRSRDLEARAALASTEAAQAAARLDLEHAEVRAPIAGRVSRALVTPGNLVSGAPASATLLTTIVSVGEAYVYADLDEAAMLRFNRLAREHRLRLENGRVPVDLQLEDEDGFPRSGYIESADNRLNPATGTLVLRMVFPNPDEALVPGLFARVRVPVSAPERALLVSERAIGTDQSQKFVLAIGEKNTVVYRPVKLGAEIGGERIVSAGLSPGDRIVVNGLMHVRPGMTVTPQPAIAEAAAPALPSRLALR